MVEYAGSHVCIVYADVTLTQSKVKVNVRAMTAAPFRGLLWLCCLVHIKW